MKRILSGVVALAVMFALTACGGKSEPDGLVSVPASSNDFQGKPYQDVVSELKDAGFTDIETVSLEDLITGWLNSPDEVEEVEIDGSTDFESDQRFAADVKIVVSYHSFPPEEQDPAESSTPSAEPSAEAAPTILTIENSPDLAALLATPDNCSPTLGDFAAKYAGQTIQFDANIGAMANHGGYDTRYDILILAGDYSETTMVGPTFQYRDVSPVIDLNNTGDNVPDTIGPGTNFRITATVGEFDSNTCQFLLEPVTTTYR